MLSGAKLLASNATPNLRLGQSVSVHKRTLVASSRDGVYVFTLPQRFIQPKLQQDDFEDGNSAGWNVHSAAWSVVSSLGSRVYRQTRTIGEGRSIFDGVDWTNQSIQADARVLGFNGAGRYFGLITRYIDDNNFYYAVIEAPRPAVPSIADFIIRESMTAKDMASGANEIN